MNEGAEPTSRERAEQTRHIVPTHLLREDTLFAFGSLTLSARQFLVVLVGGSLVATLWNRLAPLSQLLPAPSGIAVRIILVALAAGVGLAFTFVTVAGRDLLVWTVIVATYLARPRRYLWRHVHPRRSRAVRPAPLE